MHASEGEWEEGRECVVLFFILSPIKHEGESGKKKKKKEKKKRVGAEP